MGPCSACPAGLGPREAVKAPVISVEDVCELLWLRAINNSGKLPGTPVSKLNEQR